MFFLEKTFGFSIEDDELVPENMDNLQNIVRYIDRKLNPNFAKET
jgi:acyl carrier protein